VELIKRVQKGITVDNQKRLRNALLGHCNQTNQKLDEIETINGIGPCVAYTTYRKDCCIAAIQADLKSL